jgi:sugar phosphate isomerase/epimerase
MHNAWDADEAARETILAGTATNLKLNGDTYHMSIEEDSLGAPTLARRDVLFYMSMSESHRGLVGTVNWEEIGAALEEAALRTCAL